MHGGGWREERPSPCGLGLQPKVRVIGGIGDNAATGLDGWPKAGGEKCFQQICASL